nr:hypothetical protein [Tanacetum cinerariifolium]
VFGALCYPTNDGEDLGKLKPKADIGNFFIAPEPVVSTGTPSSMTIDQDAPSTSTSQTSPETPSPVIPLGVKESDHDIEVAHMDNNSSVKFPLLETSFEKSFTQMSMMDKLSFFLGLQISQSPRGIFLNQSKYALESIKKYGMETYEPPDTLMVEKSKLDEDLQGKPLILHAKPTENHLHAVKRIFRYLRGTINMGMWYPKDYCIALTDFIDADIRVAKIPEKEQVENGVVELYFVRTEYQLADIFTKPLERE